MKSPLLVSLVVASFATFSSLSFADEGSRVGKWVFCKKPAKEIQFGDWVDGKQVYFELNAIIVNVREEREGWLRVFDGCREGWIDNDDCLLPKEALTYFQGLLDANPNNTWALLMRGNARQEKGELDYAIKDYTA